MRVLRACLPFLATVGLLLALASGASAQYRASIQGVVLDPHGLAVPGAKISITAKETGLVQKTTTNDNGVYTVNRLAPGLYTLVVERSGFRTKTLTDLEIAAEKGTAVNVTLDLGAVSERVTVNGAELPAIDTETGEVSGTLATREVHALPALNRDPFQLLRLAPGVSGDGQGLPASAGPGGTSGTTSIFQTENQAQVAANGQRNEGNSFQVDGVSVNSLDWGGAAVITPNVESVKEIKITSNSYDAEYGRGDAAQIEVISQNGTNQYHGSLFLKMDRPGLNAYQGYNGPGGSAVVTRVGDRFNQFGGSVGGPIVKNKLFFFFSYETLRSNSVSQSNNWVETPQYASAVKAHTGALASQILSFLGEGPTVAELIDLDCSVLSLPDANCQQVTGGLDIGSPLTTPIGTVDLTYNQPDTPAGVGSGLDGVPDIQFVQSNTPDHIVGTQYNGRVDYQVTGKDLVTYSLYWTPRDETSYNGMPRPANLWHSNRLNYAQALLWNHTFGPTLINEARFNVSRWYFNELSTNPQQPWGLPQVSADAPTGINWGAAPSDLYKTGYNARDTVRWVRGNHSLKFGADFYKSQNTQGGESAARPSYNFNNLWDFANDAPYLENGTFNPSTGIPTNYTAYFRDSEYAFFGHDDYKLRPNLTLNLGLRWEYFGSLREKYNRLATAVLGRAPNQLTDARIRWGGNLYNSQKTNLGPHLGFAWSPHALGSWDLNNRLVVRGGFAIAFNRLEDAINVNALQNPNPYAASFSFNPGDIVYAAPSDPHQFAPYPVNPSAVLTYDPNTHFPTSGGPVTLWPLPADLKTAYTYRYSLEGEYDLGHNWIASIGYSGSTSHHLLRWVFQGQALFSPQNPQVNGVRYWANDVNANYNALLTRLQKNFSHGLELDTQYVFGKAKDEASNNYYFDAQYPFSPQAAWGPSDNEVTHNFKAWGVWTPEIFKENNWKKKVIGGWSFSGILNAHSGFPWSPIYDVWVDNTPDPSLGCSLVFYNSQYCNVRPAAYLGGALNDRGNKTFEYQLGQFPNGPQAYFTPPNLTLTGIPPLPGVGRNSFRGPRYSSVDLTASKSFGMPKMKLIGEDAKLEIRFSFYNLFNQTNLSPIGDQQIGTIYLDYGTGAQTNPTGQDGVNPASTTFDQAGSGLPGRVIDVQLRLSF